MIIPVVICSGTALHALGEAEQPCSPEENEAQLASTLSLLSWWDTPVLCVAQPDQQHMVQRVLQSPLPHGHLLTCNHPDPTLATALASVYLSRFERDPLLLFCPPGLPLLEAAYLVHTLRQAQPLADAGALVVLGVDTPLAGLFAGRDCLVLGSSRGSGGHRVAQWGTQVPHPGASSPAGPVLRNTGLYFARASVWTQAFARCLPDTLRQAQASLACTSADPYAGTPGVHVVHADTDTETDPSSPLHSLEQHLLSLLPNLTAFAHHAPEWRASASALLRASPAFQPEHA